MGAAGRMVTLMGLPHTCSWHESMHDLPLGLSIG